MKPDTMIIDGVKYYIQADSVQADSVQEKAPKVDGMERCIIRSYGAGVFIGYVAERNAELNGVNIILKQAKRIHYWDGACSLTQLAKDGTVAPDNCRITEAIDSQFIANVIEIIPVTQKSAEIIDGVPPWKK